MAAAAVAAPSDMLAFMRARAADADGRADLAAAQYAIALGDAPGNPLIAAHAYRQAVTAGDFALADRAAETLGVAAPADAALLALAEAARTKQPGAADLAIAKIERGQLAVLAAPLKAWAAFDRGADPMPLLVARRGDLVSKRFVEEARGLILLAQGKTTDGIAALRTAIGTDQAGQELRIAAAQLLIGTGREAAARELLVGDAPAIAALRAKPGQGAKPSLAFGAAFLFTRVATDLALGPPGALSIALTRAALRADPANDRARLLLADALGRSDMPDAALAELARIDADSPYAEDAAGTRIQILADAGRQDAAIAAAQARAKAGDAPDADVQRYADLLLAADRPREASEQYKRLLDRAGDSAGWSDWLQYGAALDQAGDWKRARPALDRAVALGPSQPLALNYLGYAMLEHGADVAKAQAMLERASALKPDDAAITDSLGWAYYRRGDTARALPLLERAAAASPDNAEIGEHLGDAYWAAGRRYEARYAWRAARVVADEQEAARLSAKIAAGPAGR